MNPLAIALHLFTAFGPKLFGLAQTQNLNTPDLPGAAKLENLGLTIREQIIESAGQTFGANVSDIVAAWDEVWPELRAMIGDVIALAIKVGIVSKARAGLDEKPPTN